MKRALAERAKQTSSGGRDLHHHHHPVHPKLPPLPSHHSNGPPSSTPVGGVVGGSCIMSSPTSPPFKIPRMSSSATGGGSSSVDRRRHSGSAGSSGDPNPAERNVGSRDSNISSLPPHPQAPQSRYDPNANPEREEPPQCDPNSNAAINSRRSSTNSLVSHPPPASSSSSSGKEQNVQPTPTATPDRSRSSSAKKRKRPSSSSSYTNRPQQASSCTSASDENDTEKEEEEEENEEEEEDDGSAFYLRHQNRALASELHSHKRQLSLLERERTYRRKQCTKALEDIRNLYVLWKEMEGSIQDRLLKGGDGGNGSGSGWRRRNNQAARNHVKNARHDSPVKHEEDEDMDVSDDEDEEEERRPPPSPPPASTGSGENVETVSALLDALAHLSKSHLSFPEKELKNSSAFEIRRDRTKSNEEEHENEEQNVLQEEQRLDILAKTSAEISDRVSAFRDGIWELLRRVLNEDGSSLSKPSAEDVKTKVKKESSSSIDVPALRRQIASLERKCREYEVHMKELSTARDEANATERRVLRGLYRLASGRMKIGEVLKAVENENSGSSLLESVADIAYSMPSNVNLSASLTSPRASVAVVSSSDTAVSPSGVASRDAASSATEGERVDSEEFLQLKKKARDLEEISAAREKKITELIREREDLLKRINTLTIHTADTSESSISADDVKRSSIYIETAAKLVAAEKQVENLKSEIEQTREQWAIAKGDADLVRKTMDDLLQKHEKRWKDLTCPTIESVTENSERVREGDNISCNDSEHEKRMADASSVGSDDKSEHLSHARKMIELEHKLQQALESVRQADTVRVTLAEAQKMNESLQSKLDELKAKNAALVAGKAASRASSESASSSHSSSHKSSSHSSRSIEKLQQDYRRVRKELSAAIQSKELAKSKQERAEKERDSLMKTNARLLAQSAEKDDMNAKSLSTILHLKHLTEQLTHEKELLEQKAKSAEQVALAARLATKGKERVEEEVVRERKSIQDQMEELKKTILCLQKEKDIAESRLSQSKAQMVSLVKDLSTARERCDELATESTASEEEKTRLMECVAVARREAAESVKEAAAATAAARQPTGRSRGGVNSDFTVEQLTTHISVLKGRLACPVCNDRDKKCILLRCRHMFCRQCVDENIKNRSRKCPACAQRFDMKDVGDVWL